MTIHCDDCEQPVRRVLAFALDAPRETVVEVGPHSRVLSIERVGDVPILLIETDDGPRTEKRRFLRVDFDTPFMTQIPGKQLRYVGSAMLPESMGTAVYEIKDRVMDSMEFDLFVDKDGNHRVAPAV